MATQKFHIGDVLSITIDRLVSPGDLGGTCRMLSFITGDNILTPHFPRAARACKPWLLRQFPALAPDSTEMSEPMRLLVETFDSGTTTEKDAAARWLDSWLRTHIIPKFGEYVNVESLPDWWQWESRGLIEEMEATMGKDRVIPIVVDDDMNE